MSYLDRPQFSEGQLLSAVDLQLTVNYPREQLELHTSSAHTAGVVDGLLLKVAAPSASVTVGSAVDGQGRQLRLTSPVPLAPDPLVGEPAGNYPVYIWYTEAPLTTALPPLNPCAKSSSDQIRETPAVGVFLSAAAATAQAPDAVCLGYVGWDGTGMRAVSASNVVRQGAGVRAHTIVAPEHAVAVNAEDDGPTTFSVAGTLEAIASADGTAPSVSIPGGKLAFSAATGAPASSSVTLSFDEPTATGNGLVINLGNNDPTSSVVVASAAGTPLATLDGSGTITANQGAIQNVNAKTVTIAAGANTLNLGPTPPSNKPGISASDTLLLGCGTSAGDQIEFLAGATPTGTMDATGLTMNNVKVGQLDSSSLGVGITNTADLHLRTEHGDVFVNPGHQPSAPFRFTSSKRLMNQTVAPAVDVTPLTVTNANGSAIQLGSFCVAFGTANVSVNPLTNSPPAIAFPVTFAVAPAFFLAVCGNNRTTIAAVATSVQTGSATYRITQLAPLSPSNNNPTTWSNSHLDATVSWIALGSVL
ncbi:MAG: hypothetical protein WA431_05175 [Candidatus Cybelea sp.]